VQAHADVKAMRVAFLVARGTITSITDKDGLQRHAAEIGTTSDAELEELEVRLEWGREKEAFAIRAMKNLLHCMPGQEDIFKHACIMETGFVSCANGCVLNCVHNLPFMTVCGKKEKKNERKHNFSGSD
jgi:hypothetical protein